MKILKHGNTSEDLVLSGTCDKCHCVVELTKREAKIHIFLDNGLNREVPYIPCPECGFDYIILK
jgi:hypothetical protein